jgi:CRP/FNR family transcriptional regulator
MTNLPPKSSLKPQVYAKGAFIYKEGDQAKYLYMVLKGRVKLLKRGRRGSTRNVILRVVQPHEEFGILDFFDASLIRRYDAVAMDNEVILSPTLFSEFKIVLENDLQLQTKLCREFIQMSNNLWFTYQNLNLNYTIDKVTIALKKLASSYGKATDNGVEVQGYTHQELAEVIGISRQSVSTSLAYLQKEGFLRYRRASFEILTSGKKN